MSEEVKQEGEFKVKKTKPKQLVDTPEVVKVEIKGRNTARRRSN
jgi:hypothetical protein